jgi:hypothetical protein
LHVRIGRRRAAVEDPAVAVAGEAVGEGGGAGGAVRRRVLRRHDRQHPGAVAGDSRFTFGHHMAAVPGEGREHEIERCADLFRPGCLARVLPGHVLGRRPIHAV